MRFSGCRYTGTPGDVDDIDNGKKITINDIVNNETLANGTFSIIGLVINDHLANGKTLF